jgi:glyoxylase-like metal-dependent hydrolase (beta-lactamase superfamily II)
MSSPVKGEPDLPPSPSTRPVRTVELAPGLHHLDLGISNAYVWLTTHGATLVDCGPPGSADGIRDALQHLGVSAQRLSTIVLTHFHDDHMGSAMELARWSGAEVVAGADDAPFIRGDQPGPEPRFTPSERELHTVIAQGLRPAPSCRVDREVREGDILDVGEPLTVLEVPGHTPGSIALHAPKSGVLLTGDLIAEHDGRIVLGPFNTNRSQAWQSLVRLVGLAPEIAGFGHGQPIVESARSSLALAEDAFA